MNEMVVFQKEPQIFAGILLITVCFTVLIYIYNIFVKCTNVKKDNCCKKNAKKIARLITRSVIFAVDPTYANKHKHSEHQQRIAYETPDGKKVICDNMNLSQVPCSIVTTFEKSLSPFIPNRDLIVVKTLSHSLFKLHLEKPEGKKLRKIKCSDFDLFVTNRNNITNLKTIINLCEILNYKLDLTLDLDPAYNPNLDDCWVRFKNY